MRTVILETYTDAETGVLGLGIVGVPRTETTNAATEGLLIAHDLIEHPRLEKIGTIDDELQALGALWYVRGQWGNLRRDHVGRLYSPEQNISYDVVRMYRDHFEGGQTVYYDTGLKTKPLPHIHEEALQAILEFADRDYMQEISISTPEETQQARERWPLYRQHALHRMRQGYRIARKKWERKGKYAAVTLFWAITEAVDTVLRQRPYEGQQFKLTYGNGEATCTEIWEESLD